MNRFLNSFGRKIHAHIRPIGIILLVVLLLAAATLGTVYAVQHVRDTREDARRRALAEPYELERNRLERDLANFEDMLKDPITGGATLTIVLLGADTEIYENVWPIFKEMNERLNPTEEPADPDAEPEEVEPEAQDDSGEEQTPDGEEIPEKRLTATLCLSRDKMPGMEQMMTLEQYAELRDNGWTTAVYIAQTDIDDLDAYLADMRCRYEGLGLEWTDTVFFESSIYTNAYNQVMNTNLYDEILAAHGITTVADCVDEGEDILSQDTSHDIFCVKADGWSLSATKGSAVDNYNKLLEYKGAMVFAVEIWDVSREGPTHFIPGYSDESFRRMLTKFCESVEDGKLDIAPASTAKENYVEFITEYELRVEIYEPKRQELKVRLAEVVDILDKIYSGEYAG